MDQSWHPPKTVRCNCALMLFNFKGGLIKQLLKLGYGWLIPFYKTVDVISYPCPILLNIFIKRVPAVLETQHWKYLWSSLELFWANFRHRWPVTLKVVTIGYWHCVVGKIFARMLMSFKPAYWTLYPSLGDILELINGVSLMKLIKLFMIVLSCRMDQYSETHTRMF